MVRVFWPAILVATLSAGPATASSILVVEEQDGAGGPSVEVIEAGQTSAIVVVGQPVATEEVTSATVDQSAPLVIRGGAPDRGTPRTISTSPGHEPAAAPSAPSAPSATPPMGAVSSPE